jgi:hypothetical protein
MMVAAVDMSPGAITARLQMVERLRRLCLSLARAGRQLTPSSRGEGEGPAPAKDGSRG